MPIEVRYEPGLGGAFGQTLIGMGQQQQNQQDQAKALEQAKFAAQLQQQQQENQQRFLQLYQQGALANRETDARLYSQGMDRQQQERRDVYMTNNDARQRAIDRQQQAARDMFQAQQQAKRDMFGAQQDFQKQQVGIASQFMRDRNQAQQEAQQAAVGFQRQMTRDQFGAAVDDRRQQQGFAQQDLRDERSMTAEEAAMQARFAQQQQLQEQQQRHQMEQLNIREQGRDERLNQRLTSQEQIHVTRLNNDLAAVDRKEEAGIIDPQRAEQLRQGIYDRLLPLQQRQQRSAQQGQQQGIQQRQQNALANIVPRFNRETGLMEEWTIDQHGVPHPIPRSNVLTPELATRVEAEARAAVYGIPANGATPAVPPTMQATPLQTTIAAQRGVPVQQVMMEQEIANRRQFYLGAMNGVTTPQGEDAMLRGGLQQWAGQNQQALTGITGMAGLSPNGQHANVLPPPTLPGDMRPGYNASAGASQSWRQRPNAGYTMPTHQALETAIWKSSRGVDGSPRVTPTTGRLQRIQHLLGTYGDNMARASDEQRRELGALLSQVVAEGYLANVQTLQGRQGPVPSPAPTSAARPVDNAAYMAALARLAANNATFGQANRILPSDQTMGAVGRGLANNASVGLFNRIVR